MVKVALSTGCFPSTLFIHGVHAEANLTTGGGFADIYCGHWFGRRVAVKRLRIFPTDSDQRKMRATRILYRETLIWRALDHPNILPLYGIDDQVFAPFVCMISPWMEHGNIVQYIERCTPQPSTILRLICEVAAGVEYVHERGVVHGDLRGANVLIDSSSTRHHVRLTDFGLAAIAESTPSTRSGGSIRWMAPELLDPEFFGLTTSSRSQEADVFSFAMLCIEIYTQRPPFADTPSDGAVVLSVIRGKRPRRPTYQGHRVADDIWTIIKGCWQQHPGSRTPIGRAHEELLGIIPSHLLG
ncbi:kinase-like protein [Heliocybe sulcata]|uniref:Kinase-like protein n=1 Tax=Heliocybe sulcata TaxID=5364 RepID=A0A5C3MYI5_9AGAM|nr:kinase-like protein [Heliocybe sulcata]